MPTPQKIDVVQVIQAAQQFVHNDWKERGPAKPAVSPAAAELGQAAERLVELFAAIQNEGAIRAIDAGQKVEHWFSHLGPALRLAYEAAGGPQSINAQAA